MIPLSAGKVWLGVQRDGGNWSFLTWTKNLLSLHHHPEMSLKVEEETFLILHENQYYSLSLNWSMPYQGECSQFLISSRGFDSSICDWKNNFSLFGKYHLFRIESFWNRFPMFSSFPTPPGLRSVRHLSKFPPRKERIRSSIQVKLSFQIDGFSTDPSQLKGDSQPMNQME